MPPIAERIIMAKTEMTTLREQVQSVCVLYNFHLFLGSGVPCPCIEGRDDGLHDCGGAALSGVEEGFARESVGKEFISGGSRIRYECGGGVAEEFELRGWC
jgi:hypothetical protein